MMEINIEFPIEDEFYEFNTSLSALDEGIHRLVVSNSNGNVFKNVDISTTLVAIAYLWDEDVTDRLDPN